MPFDFDTLKTFFEKTTKAIDWIVEEIVRQKNWRSLLALLDVILFIAFNPFQWPFPNLLSLSAVGKIQLVRARLLVAHRRHLRHRSDRGGAR